MIEVRRVSQDDWRQWRRLRLAALATDGAAFSSTLAEWSGPNDREERWRRRLADSPFSGLAELNGVASGMVGAFPDGDAVELVSLWVVPSARGKGVGEALIRAVVAFASGREVLLGVRAGNEPAQYLYRRCGFVDVGISPVDPRERRMRRSAAAPAATMGP